MPISEYLKQLRHKVGHDLILVPSVTGILYDDHDHILLVKHSDAGQWVAPGGSIEPNERPADALVREMWEETGLVVDPMRIVGVYGGPEFQVTYANGDQVTYLMIVFECRLLHGAMQPDGDETVDIGFFSQTELAQLNLAAWARVVLPQVFRDRGRTHFQASTWRPSY